MEKENKKINEQLGLLKSINETLDDICVVLENIEERLTDIINKI